MLVRGAELLLTTVAAMYVRKTTVLDRECQGYWADYAHGRILMFAHGYCPG